MTSSLERPVISIVTPNYNGADYLAESLDSVQSQGYGALEHVVVDGASTDASLEIIESRRGGLAQVISEPDTGHADALNKGFALTTGEIMGWINSDDVLLPGCLETVARIFQAYPDVEWITGRPSSMNARGELQYCGPARPWSRLRFLSGDHLWIQQESTFWRRSLWERSGGRLDESLKVANDFDLWARFFRHAELYSVDRMLGCFRVRPGQRSVTQLSLYERETRTVLQRELDELEPAFAERHGDQLPKHPVRLSAERLVEMEDALSVDDAPILSATALRPGRITAGAFGKVRFEQDRITDATAPRAAWAETVSRNWRFAALIGFSAGVAVALSLAFPSARIWIAVVCGFALNAAVTAAIAIKTRRIVRTLERDLRLALGVRAKAELENQLMEIELDSIQDGLDRAAAQNRSARPPDL